MLGYWRRTETHRCAGGNDQLANRAGGRADRCPVAGPGTGGGALGRRSPGRLRPRAVLPCRGVRRGRAGRTTDDLAGRHLRRRAVPARGVRDGPWAGGQAPEHLRPPVLGGQRAGPSVLSDRIGTVWESTDRQDRHRSRAASACRSTPVDPSPRPALPGRAGRPLPRLPHPRSVAPSSSTGRAGRGSGPATPIPARPGDHGGRRLSEPFRGRLFFAGEQASPGFFGYMEGALEARRRRGPGRRPRSGALRCGRSTRSARDPGVPEGRARRRTRRNLSGEMARGGGREGAGRRATAETAACVPTAEPGRPGGCRTRDPQEDHAAGRRSRAAVHERVPRPRSRPVPGCGPAAESAASFRQTLAELAAKQLPLVVDCKFGSGTDRGKGSRPASGSSGTDVGKDTWPVLEVLRPARRRPVPPRTGS